MKLNRIFTLCAVMATLALSASSLLAQDNNNGGDQGGQRRQRGGPGGGNFDPAQMQQRLLDSVRDDLNFTNDTDWDAVSPLVQKVLDARRDADTGARLMRALFRNRGGDRGERGGGDQGGNNRRRGGAFGATPGPEEEALQKAVDAGAPAAQIKDLLTKYQAAQKTKQAKLAQAESDLRAVLTGKQEAQATLLGLLN